MSERDAAAKLLDEAAQHLRSATRSLALAQDRYPALWSEIQAQRDEIEAAERAVDALADKAAGE